MTTIIPTIDDITGNTVMQKFRSLATLVLDFMTPLYESTEEVIALKPEIEQALSDALEQKALVENLRQIVINNVQTVNSLMDEVNTRLQSAVTIDGVQTIRGPKTFLANTIFTDIETDNFIATIQAEIAGMAIEMSDLKTVLSNDNGISFPGLVSMANLDAIVPTTTTGARDTKAANGSRIQNDLDAYQYMVRTANKQHIAGDKHFVDRLFGSDYGLYVGGVNETADTSRTKWYKIATFSTTIRHYVIRIVGTLNNGAFSYGLFRLFTSPTITTISLATIINKYTTYGRKIQCCVTVDTNNEIALWVNESQYMAYYVDCVGCYFGKGLYSPLDGVTPLTEYTILESKPAVGETYTRVIDTTIMQDVTE